MAATMNDGRAEQLEQEIVGMKQGIMGLRRIIVGYGIMGLNQVMILNGGQSRSITGENKEGKKGAGGQAAGDLGKGRKGLPCTSLPMGKTTVLADIEGPGIIQHIFLR